jgi:hypothetical protein
MKDSARKILDRIVNIFESGIITTLILDKPVCKPSYFDKVAKAWGITIKKIPQNEHHSGSYHHGRKKIYLTTNDRMVFYHELAHAGIIKFFSGLVDRYYDDALAEIIAQTIYVLAHGKTKNLERSNRYIEHQSAKLKKIPFEVLGEIREDAESLLEVILTPNPIFKVVSTEREKPIFFKMMIEAALFRMVFKEEHISIEIISKDESTDLENDWSSSLVLPKKNGEIIDEVP